MNFKSVTFSLDGRKQILNAGQSWTRDDFFIDRIDVVPKNGLVEISLFGLGGVPLKTIYTTNAECWH